MTTKTKRRTARRGNGEGSIFQRGDGRWSAMITIGANAAGKRVRKTVYGETKAEVQEKLTGLHTKKLTGELCRVNRETVAAFLERWLDTWVKPRFKECTYAAYERIVRLSINPKLGGVAIGKLKPEAVSALYATLAQEGVSSRQVQLVHGVLHSAFNLAVHPWRLIPFNPCHRLRPKADKPEVECPTPEETVKLLTSTRGDRTHALYVLAATGGFRLGELTGLQWADVDLEAGKVTVRRTMTNIGKRHVTSTPKSAKSRRVVSIPPVAVAALQDHKRIMLKEGLAGSEWVFLTKRGTHLRRQSTNTGCRRAMKRAGITPRKFHSLRHGFASTLLADGVPVTVVQEKLGHASPKMTLDVYAHSLPESHRDADDKLQRRFGVAAG